VVGSNNQPMRAIEVKKTRHQFMYRDRAAEFDRVHIGPVAPESPRPVNGSHTHSSRDSRDHDSGGVCSACVRIFQKRDGEMRASREI
jgi:hypothetical protein